MSERTLLSAEEFAAQKYDLPEGGRWSELVEGRVVTLDPPDEMHGATVLNLSKALAKHLQQTGFSGHGYACFELGLIVARNPDTVRCPPVSYFRGRAPFAEFDKIVTETQPALVVEVASTNARRQSTSTRISEYVDWGVETVWIVDSVEQQVHVVQPGSGRQRLSGTETLQADCLSGFALPVEHLFAEPAWWRH